MARIQLMYTKKSEGVQVDLLLLWVSSRAVVTGNMHEHATRFKLTMHKEGSLSPATPTVRTSAGVPPARGDEFNLHREHPKSLCCRWSIA